MNYLSTLSKRLGAWLAAAMLAICPASAAEYGLPTNIQDGNILHCFNWSIAQVREELTNIAAAGFGAIQLSPLQRGDITSSTTWYDAYRPYDFCFLESGFGSKSDLTALCSEADALGIKIVVDAVLNHVDGTPSATSSYHDSWWNSGDYLRWYGDVDYNSRYSITHNQMGGGSGYPDVNSENSDVASRAKAYIEELKACGVKGIRFDAAKHIGLPSESCSFWSTVCGVSDMWYYGEILDNPGSSSDDNTSLMAEYTNYMSVTDNGYSTGVRNGGGVSSGYAGWSVNSSIADNKIVYWAESHDTYANDGGESKNTSQDVIDRAYANVACRNGATALYLSRPSATASTSIKCCTKGSTHYTTSAVAEVNKFKNAMVGKADYYTNSGNVVSVTRQGGGAVIINSSGSGSVSIANGGGYATAGTYTDRVSGGTFTVTSSTISGTVGSSGIAVIGDYDTTTSASGDTGSGSTSSGSTTTGSYTDAELEAMQTVLASNPNTVFFRNSSSWSTVNCYCWSGDGATVGTDKNAAWSGASMTLVSGTSNIYYYTYTTFTPENVIFNNGMNDTESGAAQTGDLTWVNGGYYEYTTNKGTDCYVTTITTDSTGDTDDTEEGGDSGDTEDGDDSDDTSTGDDSSSSTTSDNYTDAELEAMQTVLATNANTVFFRNSSSWSTIDCYCWSGTGSTVGTDKNATWPGASMTLVSGTSNIYYYTYTTFTPENVIFNNGKNDTESGAAQTGDLTWVNGGYYEYTTNKGTDSYVETITASSTGDTSTAISGIAAEEAVPTVYYNLAGQRVSESYKGVVIVNGKKVIRK